MSNFVARISRPLGDLRSRVRAVPGGSRAWQVAVVIVGGALIVGGIVLLPLPGPGWLIIFLGLSVLATEFTWAARLLTWARLQLARFTEWAAQRSMAARVAGSVFVIAFVVVLVVLYFVYIRG